MTATTVRLPRVSAGEDLIDTLGAFHEAVRDVAAWAPSIIDENGEGSPRDARWLRAFLSGPLKWHMHDETHVLFPWLSLRESAWLDACLARTSEKHDLVRERADELAQVIEPLCAGEAVPRLRFLNATQRFTTAIEDCLRYEDDILLASARVFLDVSERRAMAQQVASADETRPWLDVAVAGDLPVVHRVHAVRARTAAGLDVVRSFAECPRGRSAPVDVCASCPHLEDLHVDRKGIGHVACAIDDAAAAPRPRVGDIMTRDVVCIERDALLTDAARVLAESCVTGLPVVDVNGRPIGVVSQSDIVAAIARDGELGTKRVGDVMMHVPIVVREGDSVDDAAKLLVIEGIHRLPVIGADQSVVGIVSTLDLLRITVRPRPATAA